MRVDCTRGVLTARPWTVFDCWRCQVVPGVVWADDRTRQWCQVSVLLGRAHQPGVHVQINTARALTILPREKTILIDPVPSDTLADETPVLGVHVRR